MIYFTFDPRPDLKEDLLKSFPNEQFIFSRTVEDEKLAAAEILVTYGEDLVEAHIKKAKNLKWIMVASAGVEKMPAQAIVDANIKVTNVRGIHKIPMAESALAHILSYYRNLQTLYEMERQATWNHKIKSRELHGQTALILGAGAIGGEMARLLQAFGVKTIGCNRSGQQANYMNEMVSLEEIETVLPQADIVISILPSTEETYHLLKTAHFKLMKNSALFMNFGRGSLVQNEVLLAALNDGEIGYAVCDVFENEPLSNDHPFWDHDKITVSPHVSSHSSRYLERSFAIFKPNLHKWRQGEVSLENELDLLRGY